MYVIITELIRIKYLKVLPKGERAPQAGFMASSFISVISINDCGEILNFCLTPGNIDDRNPKVIKQLTKGMFGKIFADKGYISKKLFDTLWDKGIQLITKQKKNIKNKGLMKLTDRLLLRKRAVIESVNDFLKNICQIEHSRHRSYHNFVVNLISGLAAYSYIPKKPSIRTDMTAILI